MRRNRIISYYILLILSYMQPSIVCAQMKTWWFFGYENTTHEGIRADVRALKNAGFRGVVYYDQNHAKSNNGAEDGFSPLWWKNMIYAISEAHKAGLSVEMNISNGYVAGGKWIDAEHAMQRVAFGKTFIKGGSIIDIALPPIKGRDNYVKDIALLAFPTNSNKTIRHFTAVYSPNGKGKNGAMQTVFDERSAKGEFSGAKFQPMADIGVLQASNDSINWRDIIKLGPMYSSQGVYPVRTNSFNAVDAKFWRVSYLGHQQLREWSVGSEALIDRWEEKTGLQCDFIEKDNTPNYDYAEVIKTKDIVDLGKYIKDGRLVWNAPNGEWTILRLAAVLTGAKSKHGRPNILGYECDKLSAEAALLHWNSYMQVILDTLHNHNINYIEGVTMDSHEGGSQNWTPRMLTEFQTRRGYDLRPFLPVLAGYVVDSKEKTNNILFDLRRTISDCIRENYYGTFQQKAKQNNLVFTAQAIGNALCIPGDAISVKKAVDKPQGEFWTYQCDGAYDIKDCSSAAHLYAKPVASAEAMTDACYKNTSYDLKRVADIAFAFGAQEMVVCATPHIPYPHTNSPYIAGREYAINRSNPRWKEFFPMWKAINRTFPFVKMGKADPDILVYLGDELPMKILTHRLPLDIERFDWDACTGDALQTRLTPCANGCLSTPDSVVYKALIIGKDAYISPASQKIIEKFKEAGVRILNDIHDIEPATKIEVEASTSPERVIVHMQRKLDDGNLYFFANIDKLPHTATITINNASVNSKWKIYHTNTGKWKKLKFSNNKNLTICFDSGESIILKRQYK